MRILVCGGRDYKRWMNVYDALTEHYPCHVINGGAEGADNASSGWAKSNEMPLTVYPAQWGKYGKSAGYIRNKQMLEEGKPDLVLAFPGGKGTAMMVKLAKEASIPVKEFEE